MSKGWVVAVERSDGELLYVVAAENADDAEEILATGLALPDLAVRVVSEASRERLSAFKLRPGEFRGPM